MDIWDKRERETATQWGTRKQVQAVAWFQKIKTKYNVYGLDRKLEKKCCLANLGIVES
jgi:hypothetical protein